MPAGDHDEGIDRLDHAGPGGPAAADTGRERDDGHLPATQRLLAALDGLAGQGASCGDQAVVLDVADIDVDRQPVAGEPDPPALEVLAKAGVLDRIEPVLG